MNEDDHKSKNEELKQHIHDEIKSLDADLEEYKKALEEYKNIPEGAEVGNDYHETLRLLQEVADTLDSLPKKLKSDD